MTELEYDLFVSYASEDEAWAAALHERLDELGINSFLDRTRLSPGANWSKELLGALNRSRHLIVLWSEHARRSDWVNRELNRFEAAADPGGEGLPPGRRLVFLELDTEHAAYGQLQAITDLRRSGLYPDAGPQGAVWDAMTRSLADTLRADQKSLPIPLLLVTTTEQGIDTIDVKEQRGQRPQFCNVLHDLSIGDMQTLRSRYGRNRCDWHPFGSDSDVHTILANLSDEINQEIQEVSGGTAGRFHWDYVEEEFWTDNAVADRVARRLGRGPAVVVIDPLSFYDPEVFDRYANHLSDVLANGDAFLLVLAPYAPPPTSVALRDMVEVLAGRIFKQFFRPPAFSGTPYARCGFPVGDEVELWGWVASAVGPQLRPRSDRIPYLGATFS
jgi:TIR domain-containing protein